MRVGKRTAPARRLPVCWERGGFWPVISLSNTLRRAWGLESGGQKGVSPSPGHATGLHLRRATLTGFVGKCLGRWNIAEQSDSQLRRRRPWWQRLHVEGQLLSPSTEGEFTPSRGPAQGLGSIYLSQRCWVLWVTLTLKESDLPAQTVLKSRWQGSCSQRWAGEEFAQGK